MPDPVEILLSAKDGASEGVNKAAEALNKIEGAGAKAESGLNRAEAASKKQGDASEKARGQTERHGEALSRTGEQAGEMVRKIAEITAVMLGLESIREAALRTAELGSQLVNLSSRTGIAIPNLVVLRQAFQNSGESAEEAGLTINRMQMSIVEAAEKGGPLAELLTKLHLSASDLSAEAPEEQFEKIAKAIGSMQNPAEKSAAALQLLGRAGGNMIALFNQKDALGESTAQVGKLAEVMGRIAPDLKEVNEVIARLPNKATELFAGIFDSTRGMILEIAHVIDSIDLTGIGQKIGAAMNVVIQAFKDGKLSDLLGLLIEAGFELGTQAAQYAWNALIGSIQISWTSGVIPMLINGMTTFGVQSAKVIFDMLQPFTMLGTTTLLWLTDQFRFAFQTVGRFLTEIFDKAIRFFSIQMHGTLEALKEFAASGGNTGAAAGGYARGTAEATAQYDSQAKPGQTGINSAMTWNQANQASYAATSAANKEQQKYLDDQQAAMRQIISLGETAVQGDSKRVSALEKLKALYDAQLKAAQALRDIEIGDAEKSAGLAGSTELPRLDGAERKIAFDREEKVLREQLLALQRQGETDQASFGITEVEKWKLRQQNLDDEKKKLTEIIALEKQRQSYLKDKGDTQGSEEVVKKMQGDQTKLAGLDVQGAKQGADPTSFADQWTKTMTDLQNKWGTWAQQTASTFASVFNTAISSVSKGISGLIMGTTTWGKALFQIGTTILTSLVQSIVEMGVKWITQHVIMGAISKLFYAQDLATHTATEATKVGVSTASQAAITGATVTGASLRAGATVSEVATTTGAVTAGASTQATATGIAGVFRSIMDLGPIAGPVVMAAAVAAMIALVYEAVKGFSGGGYTGDGAKYEVAGTVHKGEYVFTQDEVARIGVGNVAAFAKGYLPVPAGFEATVPAPLHQSSYATGGFVGSAPSSPAAGSTTNVSIGMLDSRQAMRDFQRKEGVKITLQAMKQRSNRVNT